MAVGTTEREVAELIVTALNLDMDAGEIDPDAPLYGEGLGLDSIDMLELSMTISKKYGVHFKSGDADNAQHFSSLRTLTKTIDSMRNP